jgi:glyoxylase-like metal-dependent hydrolase (beta-lactamase superfamily II)
VNILPLTETIYLENHVMHALEVGQGDTSNATVLHVPSLDLVVTGDVAYGNCFQMFEETNTTQLQNLWLLSLDKVEALHPKIVVPSHMQVDDGYAPTHLEASRQYVVEWEKAVKAATKWQDVENTMKALYPNRIGDYILRVSAQTPFNATF